MPITHDTENGRWCLSFCPKIALKTDYKYKSSKAFEHKSLPSQPVRFLIFPDTAVLNNAI
jgi:hypothetical protein